MDAHSLRYAGIRELAGHMEAGTVTSEALVAAQTERIDALNPTCKAFIHVSRQVAAKAAVEADRRPWSGTLHGIPFASKDLFDVAGEHTTAGSKVLADNVAAIDATVIARMREAGAISMGKLNMHEFAYGATGENPIYGTAVNAFDPTRIAGGSSSGSAASVAFGLVPATFGTDTGGSTRAPAALSGLLGLKPTFGRISRHGLLPYSWSLDHVGIMARNVEDVAILLRTIGGADPLDQDAASEPLDDYVEAASSIERLDGLRIGIPRAFFFERLDSEIERATWAVLRHLERAGATCIDVTLPSMEHTRTVSLTVQMPEALSFHMPYLENRGSLYGADFRAGLALGQSLLAEHYVRAKRMINVYRQQTDLVFNDVDILITPASPVIAPKIGESHVVVNGELEPAGNAITRYTSFFNMTGHPAITVPSGMHSAGVPMGVQIIGRHFDEATLLRVAQSISCGPVFQLPLPAIATLTSLLRTKSELAKPWRGSPFCQKHQPKCAQTVPALFNLIRF